MTDGVSAGLRDRVRCATGLLTLGDVSAACGLGSVFWGIAKFEGSTTAGVDSTLGGGANLRGGTNLVDCVSLGRGGGGVVVLVAGGISEVLVCQLLKRSWSLEMAESCLW